MKNISDITVLVSDGGLFLPFARRMAESCKRVIFHNPDRCSFPSLKQGVVGDGFPDIESTLDFWPMIDEVDLFCFPDISQAGLQEYLVSIGKSVWGSRSGDSLEIGRERFMRFLGESGLSVPKFSVAVGVSELREHLKPLRDQYIKISRWRGDLETTHWRDWTMDKGWLDWLAVNLGPLAEHVRFLVFPKIETDLEIGADTIFVKDQWPKMMLSGLEAKDLSYFGAVKAREEMPDAIQEVISAATPFLTKCGYTNQISFEVRVKDDLALWIDATQRASQPGSASQQLLWKNFPEIVWAGANGELVEPEPVAKYSIECMVTSKPGKDCWDVVELPKSIDRSVRFSSCGFDGGCYVFPPDEFHDGELGWLCATGDTPIETLESAKEICDQLPDGLEISLESLVDIIKEVESAQKQSIELSGDEPMPEIEDVAS